MKRATNNSESRLARDENLRQALEQAGWRYTPQRAAVFAYLTSHFTHPTAEEVFQEIRPRLPKLSLATVYKALEALVDAGLVKKLVDQTGRAHYDGRQEKHYHFRSTETGKVVDLPLPYDDHFLEKLDPDVIANLQRQGYVITGHSLELQGHATQSKS